MYPGCLGDWSSEAHRPAWRRETPFDTAVQVPATTAVLAIPPISPTRSRPSGSARFVCQLLRVDLGLNRGAQIGSTPRYARDTHTSPPDWGGIPLGIKWHACGACTTSSNFRTMYLNGLTSNVGLMLVQRTSGLTRRAALGSFGALALGAAISGGSRLASAQQPDTRPQSLSELNQRRPARSPVVGSGLVWKGYAADAANVRAEPTTESEITRELAAGDGVVVPIWVAGEEVNPDYPVWAELEPGQFVYLPLLRSFPVEEPPPISQVAPREGRWIDVNLTLEIVTAYEGRTPVATYIG
jgi:hypothetical protein